MGFVQFAFHVRFRIYFLMLFNFMETEHLWNVSYKLQATLSLLRLVLLVECGMFFSASDWLPIESSWFVDSIQVTLNRPQRQPYPSDSQFSKWALMSPWTQTLLMNLRQTMSVLFQHFCVNPPKMRKRDALKIVRSRLTIQLQKSLQ